MAQQRPSSERPAQTRPARLRWVRRGECNRCGRCCLAGTLWDIMTPQEKAAAERWSRGHFERLLLAAGDCPHLDMRGELATCRIHDTRPWHCRVFPQDPTQLLPGCSYWFVAACVPLPDVP